MQQNHDEARPCQHTNVGMHTAGPEAPLVLLSLEYARKWQALYTAP